ncbi:hypothetical protein [Noviherbaspirillum sp.]|uniref:hypothetical protein n=1 Tax=Noviherbaspirillum sp. TaxID=1926288 RepID=UPI002B460B70|nr:hypothetical protein [Noviherbaspirillum sp.]HJV79856.1 hypothetical protein [Noviherbaspirillum sp.]
MVAAVVPTADQCAKSPCASLAKPAEALVVHGDAASDAPMQSSIKTLLLPIQNTQFLVPLFPNLSNEIIRLFIARMNDIMCLNLALAQVEARQTQRGLNGTTIVVLLALLQGQGHDKRTKHFVIVI